MINISEMPKLGFGLMRLPKKGDAIDLERVCTMADAYMKAGLNYFDTAYVYHEGHSEEAVKEVLVKRYPRDCFYLATKLPAWSIHGEADRERIFNEQLERTGAGYFDFYLLHSVEDGSNYDTYVKYDCFNFCLQKKAEGKIRHFGFSFHGTPELLEEILDAHPEIEFVQIQLNYLDWNNPLVQSGRLYDILLARKIPMIIMEPVKGGTLASFEQPGIEEMMKAARPDASAASWAIRFVASLDGVMTILSGMSTEEQMEDNLRTITHFEPLSDGEKEIIRKITAAVAEAEQIQCTSCRYCTPGCPMGIRIPDVFRALNTKRLYPADRRPLMYYGGLTADSGKASDCIACGQCEGVCPQHLPIIEYLKEAAEKLEEA